jgi:hypothetical protein
VPPLFRSLIGAATTATRRQCRRRLLADKGGHQIRAADEAELVRGSQTGPGGAGCLLARPEPDPQQAAPTAARPTIGGVDRRARIATALERSRSSRTSRAPRSLPRAERNCQPGRRANCSRQGSGLSIRAAERLLASCGSPASKRSWVRTSLLIWIVGAAPAGRALRHSSERPGRADRTHAPAHTQAPAVAGSDDRIRDPVPARRASVSATTRSRGSASSSPDARRGHDEQIRPAAYARVVRLFRRRGLARHSGAWAVAIRMPSERLPA